MSNLPERLRWKAGQEAREAFLVMVLRGLRELLATQAAGAEWAHGEDSILTLGKGLCGPSLGHPPTGAQPSAH